MSPFVRVRRDGSITTIERQFDRTSYRTTGARIVREIRGGKMVALDLTIEELRALLELSGDTAKRGRA